MKTIQINDSADSGARMIVNFAIWGNNKPMVVMTTEENNDVTAICLTTKDAEKFASELLQYTKAHKASLPVQIETSDDNYLSVQVVTPTVNDVPQSDEVCILMADVDESKELVTTLSFEQTREFIRQLQRLIE